jgi:hypothetical protein
MRLYAATLIVIAVALPSIGQTGPTVGDPVFVDLGRSEGESITIAPPEGIEIDRETESGVVVRSFRPGTVSLDAILTSETGQSRSITRQIEIMSVLHPDDDLEPAPLSPPLPLSRNRGAWTAIATAAVGAAVVWILLLLAPRPRTRSEAAVMSPSAELIQTVERIRRLPPSDARLARVADAVRRFLFRVDPALRRSLTSAELLARIRQRREPIDAVVRDVLEEGDYAKFSPWGGRAAKFDDVAEEATRLASLDREETR